MGAGPGFGGLDMRTQKFAFPIAAISVIIAALMAVPVGGMLGLMGPSVHAPVAA